MSVTQNFSIGCVALAYYAALHRGSHLTPHTHSTEAGRRHARAIGEKKRLARSATLNRLRQRQTTAASGSETSHCIPHVFRSFGPGFNLCTHSSVRMCALRVSHLALLRLKGQLFA